MIDCSPLIRGLQFGDIEARHSGIGRFVYYLVFPLVFWSVGLLAIRDQCRGVSSEFRFLGCRGGRGDRSVGSIRRYNHGPLRIWVSLPKPPQLVERLFVPWGISTGSWG